MAAKSNIGFLGAGKMASALAKGLVATHLFKPSQILASDPVKSAREHFSDVTGARCSTSNVEVVEFADTVVLSVKPDQVPAVLAELRALITPRHVLISIAAGVPLAKIEAALEPGSRVIRVMPNTPALVGLSASAFALGKAAKVEDGQLAFDLLSAIGVAVQLKESLLDAVTGLSGSGPAYVCMMIEALSDGGVAAGLPREVATKLAAQTVMGSAKMVLETGLHPGVLKDMVTSPGGTTVEGLHELEKAGVRGALMSAVRAASEKSRKLGQT